MFSTVEEALKELSAGKMIVLLDDEDRENEGDLIMAAEHCTPEKMAFFIRYTGGVVFLALSNEIADKLDLPPMVINNTSERKTAFTVSIDAAEGISTGISAVDRSKTAQIAINPNSKPTDLVRPGHLFPLRALDGGVLVRNGHTESSVDLCKLAGLRAGAIGSELMNDDGTLMRLPELTEFARKNNLLLLTVADVVAYRQSPSLPGVTK